MAENCKTCGGMLHGFVIPLHCGVYSMTVCPQCKTVKGEDDTEQGGSP